MGAKQFLKLLKQLIQNSLVRPISLHPIPIQFAPVGMSGTKDNNANWHTSCSSNY